VPSRLDPIRAVGFDLDYTLWDQEDFYRTFFQAQAREFGRRLGCGPRLFVQAGASALEQLTPAHAGLFDRVLAQLGAWQPRLVEELVDRFHRHRPPMAPYPGARETLERLRAGGWRLFLVTDGYAPTQRSKVATLGLAACFEVLVFTGELPDGQQKPSPAPFRLACDRLGLPPSQCLYVGDHPALDVPGPRSLGMLTAGVATGPFARWEPPPGLAPDLGLGALEEVADRLAGDLAGSAP
jgi:putative hydrolase of the HAD superfamily